MSSAAPRRRRTTTALILLVVAAALLGVHWLLQSGETAQIQALLNAAIGPASGGLYRVEIESGDVGLLTRSLHITGLQLAPVNEAGDADRGARLNIRIDNLEVQGVRIIPLLRRTAIIARSVQVSDADLSIRLRLGRGDATAPARPAGGPEPSFEDEARRALAGVPEIRIGEIRLADVSGQLLGFDGDSWSAGPLRTDRVGRLELVFRNLHIHENATLDEMRRFYSDDVSLTVEELDLGGRLEAKRIELSTGKRSARLEGVEIHPRFTVQEYLARSTVREADRISLWVDHVEATGFDPAALLSHAELGVDKLAVSGFRLEVLHDRHKPPSPPRRQWQPHDIVGALPVRLRVGSVELADGFVSYTERAPGVEAPGAITFEKVGGTIAPIDSGAAHADPPPAAGPVVADLQTSLYGSVPVALKLQIPLREPATTMHVEGRISAFDSTVLNGILTPLEGLRVGRGEVQGAEFAIDYVPGHATGTVQFFYRDLDIGLVAKDGGRQDLGQKVLSFLADRLGIHGANPSEPGEAPRVGHVDVDYDDTWPFFKTLWVPLRDGLLGLVRKL